MADEHSDHDSLISQFLGMSDISSSNEARRYLEANQWSLESAVAEYYTSQEEGLGSQPIPEDDNDSETDDQPPLRTVPGGGHVLGSESTPQPIPTTSSVPPASSSSSKNPPKKKFATLGDLRGGTGASHAGHGHDEEDDDDDDQDLFTGGEKSALAVQNPDEVKRKILERARKNIPRPGGDDPVAPSSHFRGAAHTLGGDDTPSQLIEDPAASQPRKAPRIKRTLHFWEDGFSVDDGELYRLDDPANAEILRQIRQGSAPLSIMNVEKQQEIDVSLEQHQEKYMAPKKKYKPFSGGGQRLGSPTPGPVTSSEPSRLPESVLSDLHQRRDTAPESVEVNDSEPIISLQIRLGDGTRLVSRFNVTHTIGDVYSFVAASSPASQGRSWVLMTTFPSKELQDKAQILGDLAEFKRGGVVVQKWK